MHLPRRLLATAALAATLCAPTASAKVIALLVGIAHYAPPYALQGPTYDVAAMKAVITTKMGAAPQDIHVLLNEQATQAGILAELKTLKDRSAPGDTVVIYFSGHGTSSRDSDNASLHMPMGTSALIPVDATEHTHLTAADLITGRLHLLPLALKPLDEGGRNVLLISDSCFSGNIVRAVGAMGTSKYMPIGGADAGPASLEDAGVELAAYPYRHVVMISASADTEKALDLVDQSRNATIDGLPKGALTDALLRAFAGKIPTDFNGDGQVSFAELQRAVREDLGRRGIAQSPQILPSLAQDKEGITFTPVPGLGATASPSTSGRITVSVPAGGGTITNGLGQGGEFTVTPGAGEFQILRGQGGNRFSLRNRAGDMILEEESIDVVFDRLRAGAWASRAIAGASARVDLSADTQPAAKGGTFMIGRDHLRMALKASAAVSYLVVNVDSHGRLVTLWPTTPSEDIAMPTGRVQTIPDTPIIASDPAGLDHVLVLAFPAPPPGMAQWYNLNAPFGSATANQFTQWLAALKAPYAATTFDVRTVAGAPQ
jgi:hypothetical protein